MQHAQRGSFLHILLECPNQINLDICTFVLCSFSDAEISAVYDQVHTPGATCVHWETGMPLHTSLSGQCSQTCGLIIEWSCEEPGIALHVPSGSLPTRAILRLYDSIIHICTHALTKTLDELWGSIHTEPIIVRIPTQSKTGNRILQSRAASLSHVNPPGLCFPGTASVLVLPCLNPALS